MLRQDNAEEIQKRLEFRYEASQLLQKYYRNIILDESSSHERAENARYMLGSFTLDGTSEFDDMEENSCIFLGEDAVINDTNIDILVNFLKGHLDITCLRLISHEISVVSVKKLAALTNITKLEIGDTPTINNEACLTVLANSSHLTHLGLFKCGISDQGAIILAQLNSSLTHLYLNNNSITDVGAKALVSMMNLIKLEVVNNNLSAENGSKILAETGLTTRFNYGRDVGVCKQPIPSLLQFGLHAINKFPVAHYDNLPKDLSERLLTKKM